MSIKPHISPRLIPNIASLYNDVNRIFLEYIDNSLDSAESYYDQNTNSYNKKIEITLKIEGHTSVSGKITISDNCFGITNFTKLVEDIGNSDKKAQAWTNGQFGYGIYSFMAACNKLEVLSKIEGQHALYMPIERDKFYVDKIDDLIFPDPQKKSFSLSSGTVVFLSEFDKPSWKQINIEELKAEIEKHFEFLLRRKNLTVALIDSANNEYICKPFSYDEHEGEVYEDVIDKLSLNILRRSKVIHETFIPPKPIHIFIKVIKGKTINKSPIFVAKGRRISEVKDIKSFKSKHKSDLWGHPNLTGYIDVDDFLEPTIARNDFKNTVHSRALFEHLLKIEPLLFDVIEEVNKSSEKRHYKMLEDRLNEALSKLAKIDAMNFRTQIIPGDKIPLQKGSKGQGFNDDGSGGPGDDGLSGGHGNGHKDDGRGHTGANIDGGLGGKNPGLDGDGNKPLQEEADNPFRDSEHMGDEKKKSGFNIRIVDTEPIIDAESQKQYRSYLFGNEIRIYKLHPDFEQRVHTTRSLSKKITQRLITYLAGEITVHYKDKFHNKNGQPEYNKNLFVDLVDFIYQLENMLADLNGKDLSDFN